MAVRVRGVTAAVVLLAAAMIAAAGGSARSARSTASRDCSLNETHRLVEAFIGAFNNGRSARLNRIFASAPSFKWYSTDAPGRRLGAAAYARSTLIRYFRARHARRERLTLTSWRGGGNANGYAHFQFGLIRQARDLQPTEYEGKGAIICGRRNSIAVWSMGRRS